MRVTNNMMNNSMMLSISRNMRYLDKLYSQIHSTKKIQVPSDDPIIASRALKFRTNVSETEQFQRNVENGLAWMGVTESSFINVVEKLLKQIRERCVEGATGTETALEDKSALIAEIREMVDQIGVEMNQTYAGRYVFSGFRTDQPPVFTVDNNFAYTITQTFVVDDVEKTKSYQKIVDNGPATDEPLVHSINVLKLAYDNLSIRDSVPVPPIPELSVSGFDVILVNESDSAAYTPPSSTTPPVVHYIPETGELVMSDDALAQFPAAGLTVTYDKVGFKKGELNPQVYFTCTDLQANPPLNQFNMNNQEIQYEFSTSTYVTINALSMNVYTDKMYADLKRLCDFADSLSLSDAKLLEEKYTAQGLTGQDLQNAIDNQLNNEKAMLNAALYDRFNNMLYLIDRHSTAAMKEHTQLGSRMLRLDLIQARLEQDEAIYTKLLSDNEDTDMVKALTLQSSAEAAYQASLKVGSNIVQMTLANFIG